MESIIWDWNGTLLNDLELCILTINKLLDKRELPLLDSNAYKEAFSFPVENYYRTIGFNFEQEDFSVPAGEFIEMYNKSINECDLHSNAHKILTFFRESGKRQFILSAMKHTMLECTLKNKGIYNFFEAVAGLNDHYAVSKIERGNELIRDFNINRESAYIIGDTDHDYEVAIALGINCILVADGHQSEKRLRATGARVVGSLVDLTDPDLFCYHN
ncbi:MAG: HAD hydrolase-like protein [Prolixibacteraceae bacterium]|nr:HAD hydrolase-like protein [Prolixibacteraceae bacterium]MDD4755485.1 HAD hydrolase-like protein [Prolixibacteraceae bacterium]